MKRFSPVLFLLLFLLAPNAGAASRDRLLFGIDSHGFFENAARMDQLSKEDRVAYVFARADAKDTKEWLDREVQKLGRRFQGFPLAGDALRTVKNDYQREMALKNQAPAGDLEDALSSANVPTEVRG